jgi:hypothetical protein
LDPERNLPAGHLGTNFLALSLAIPQIHSFGLVPQRTKVPSMLRVMQLDPDWQTVNS